MTWMWFGTVIPLPCLTPYRVPNIVLEFGGMIYLQNLSWIVCQSQPVPPNERGRATHLEEVWHVPAVHNPI